MDFIYFSSIDWNATWQRPQQLASRLAQHERLLYISPFGLRSAGLRDLGRGARRAVFWLKAQAADTRHARLKVYTPLVYLPFPHSAIASRVNAGLLQRVLRNWCKRLDVTQPIVWVGSPSPLIVQALEHLNPRFLIYDCLDNVAFFHGENAAIMQAEQTIAAKAQIVFATAGELYEKMTRINPHTVLLPNAADFNHFARAADSDMSSPSDIAQIPTPILGYFGEIAPWFDLDLVYDLAISNPNWSIVLIGQSHMDVARKLFNLPNVFYLGRKNYADLPAYLSRFDVCLLPFKINALTSAVNPVKLYEYLAAGKPVVSTPLKEVLCYREIVEIADRTEFSAAVRRALEAANADAMVKRRQEIARQNTWERRVEDILRIIREAE